MNQPKHAILTVAALLFVMAACRTTPCVTCHALLVRGLSVEGYLASHPKPLRTTVEADGGHTYEWVYTANEKVPLELSAEVAKIEPSGLGGKAWESMVGALLLIFGAKPPQGYLPNPKFSTINGDFYYVSIRTDARDVVRAFTCNHANVKLEETHME